MFRHVARGWCATVGTASATARRIGAAVASGKLGSGQARRFSAVAAASRSGMTRSSTSITTTSILRSSCPPIAAAIAGLIGCARRESGDDARFGGSARLSDTPRPAHHGGVPGVRNQQTLSAWRLANPRIGEALLRAASSTVRALEVAPFLYGDAPRWPITTQRRGESTLLNSRDIAALNRARDVLRRVEDAAWKRSLGQFDPYAPVSAWDLGRLSEAATVADDAIFHVLSTARTSCGLNVTDVQLAGPQRAQEQAPPLEGLQAPKPAEPPEAAVRLAAVVEGPIGSSERTKIR